MDDLLHLLIFIFKKWNSTFLDTFSQLWKIISKISCTMRFSIKFCTWIHDREFEPFFSVGHPDLQKSFRITFWPSISLAETMIWISFTILNSWDNSVHRTSPTSQFYFPAYNDQWPWEKSKFNLEESTHYLVMNLSNFNISLTLSIFQVFFHQS